jgi:hypothetical protein
MSACGAVQDVVSQFTGQAVEPVTHVIQNDLGHVNAGRVCCTWRYLSTTAPEWHAATRRLDNRARPDLCEGLQPV